MDGILPTERETKLRTTATTIVSQDHLRSAILAVGTSVYVSPPCTQALADRLGLYVQAYTLYSSVRPFGCSTILGGIDKDGPSIYVIEPSGVFYVRTRHHLGQSHYLTSRATGLPRCRCR
jgi:20S proteasome alpha/beta subunit